MKCRTRKRILLGGLDQETNTTWRTGPGNEYYFEGRTRKRILLGGPDQETNTTWRAGPGNEYYLESWTRKRILLGGPDQETNTTWRGRTRKRILLGGPDRETNTTFQIHWQTISDLFAPSRSESLLIETFRYIRNRFVGTNCKQSWFYATPLCQNPNFSRAETITLCGQESFI